MSRSPTHDSAVLLELHPAQPRPSRPERSLFYGFLALLLFGPLAFGAVEPWAMAVQQVGTAALVLLWLWLWVNDAQVKLRFNLLYLPWAVLALVAALQFALRIPPYLHAAIEAALEGLAYFLIFFLANQLFRLPERTRTALRVFVVYGFLLALYSMLTTFTAPGMLLGFRQPRAAGVTYGPYVNHNHYAGLMELLLPFALLMALRQNLPAPRRLMYAGAALIMAASVFLSASLGGMIALGAEVAVVTGLLLAQRETRQSKWGLAAGAAALAVLLFWLGFGNLFDKIASLKHPEISAQVRWQITGDAVRMGAAHPWLGWGLGNFEVVYPQFRSFYTDLTVSAAHNEYAQFFAEFGVWGVAAVAAFLIIVLRSGSRLLPRWQEDSASVAGMAACIAVIGLAVHSFSDFNLRIPANAALFVAQSALATVRSGRHE